MPLAEVIAFPSQPREQSESKGFGDNNPGMIASLSGNLALGLTPNQWGPQTQPNANSGMRRGAVEGFVRTCERWKLSHSEQVVLLGYRGDDLAAQPVLTGRTRASQDIRDRTGYVLSISIGLAALYNDSIDAEINWLKRPHEALSGASPLNVMLDGKMLSLIRVHALVMMERGL